MFTKFAPQNGGGATLQVAETFYDGKRSRHKSVLYIGSGKTKEELESLLEEGEAAIARLKASRQQLPLSGIAPPKKRKKKNIASSYGGSLIRVRQKRVSTGGER